MIDRFKHIYIESPYSLLLDVINFLWLRNELSYLTICPCLRYVSRNQFNDWWYARTRGEALIRAITLVLN